MRFLLILFISIHSFALTPKKLVSFDDIIWGFSFINKFEVLITLKEGALYHYDLRSKKKRKLKSPPSSLKGQGGLLDILYYQNEVFISFTQKLNGKFTTSLSKGSWSKGEIKDLKVIFKSNALGSSGRHFGSRLLIHKDELYMTIGDRGERDKAQDLNLHNGKILRMTREGRPLKSNPFYTDDKDPKSYIFTYGHRNPQGIDLNKSDGEIYSIEFGPRGGDELNLIKKGLNYGWPVITYGKEYWGPKIGKTHKKGMEQPVKYWTPSISPSGFLIKESKTKGIASFYLACLGNEELRKLTVKNGRVIKEESLFLNLSKRIRQVRSFGEYIYFSTDEGQIYSFKD